jgi:hypothetical protein
VLKIGSSSVTKNMNVHAPYSGFHTMRYWQSYPASDVPRVLNDLHGKYKAGLLEKLEPQDCVNKYATSIISNRRHVLLVASDENFPTVEENIFLNGSHVYWAAPFYATDAQNAAKSANAYNWICSGMEYDSICSNDVDNVKKNISAWRTGHYCLAPFAYEGALCNDAKTFPVQYCLSERAQPHCRLQFDTTIAVVVTVLNAGRYLFHYFRRPIDYARAWSETTSTSKTQRVTTAMYCLQNALDGILLHSNYSLTI